jgi:hypothetical protein
VGLERGPLSLVSKTEELLIRKSRGSGLEIREYGRRDVSLTTWHPLSAKVSRSASQYVLVSSTLVGLATRYYFLSECCCLKVAFLFLWGRPL